jgi:iron complex transport system substrate-binding protein
VSSSFTRRQALGWGALLVAGCGSPAKGSGPTPASDPFPVSVPNAFGATEIAAFPERIVSVGFKDQDALLALGAVPIAIREWFGQKPYAVWPWAEAFLGGAQPAVLPRAELNYEQIAALRPDLIVGQSSGMTRESYDRLNGIAPTVAQPSTAGDYAITWQEMTRTAGAILGRTADAERLINDLDGRISAAAAAHPAFDGASMVLGSAVDGQVYLYGADSTAVQALAALGLRVPDEVARLADNADAYYVMSPERFDLTDVDLALWSEAATDAGPQSVLSSELYRRLDVHAEGRDLFLGLDLYNGALVFASVLSLPLVLEELVPQMALAIDGDPRTRAELNPAA